MTEAGKKSIRTPKAEKRKRKSGSGEERSRASIGPMAKKAKTTSRESDKKSSEGGGQG